MEGANKRSNRTLGNRKLEPWRDANSAVCRMHIRHMLK
jgi:hypothetical protein